MDQELQSLNEILAEITDIYHSLALLSWDQQVYMPSGGAVDRGNMMATLSKIAHEKFTSDEVGNLLSGLKKYLPELDSDSETYRIIKVTADDYDKTVIVPVDFIMERARVTAVAQQAWVEARQKSDYSIFLPHIEKVIELNQKYVTYFPKTDHPYDVLLDGFEPGMKTSEVQTIFTEIRPKQVELIKTIGQQPQVEDGFMHLSYDQQRMWDFSAKISGAFGFDWKRGRQDATAHPFCQSIGIDDVRITSRWVPEKPFALLFGTMHETGHGLYDQGIGHTWSRTALEGGASLGIHESQSRLWENLIGRSKPFWEYFYPQLQDTFTSQLGNVTLDQFYRAINKVEPSNIRVEADEATYNLHIMLRLELEIGMLEGTISAKELPAIWNEKMKEYLGVVPPNDAKGVLQDIHWSSGMFGYFSTYALGNIISAQLWEKFTSLDTEVEDQIRQGDFSSLLSWLRVKIHQYGRKYEPQELVQRVTKSKIDSAPYLRYLTSKYKEIYNF